MQRQIERLGEQTFPILAALLRPALRADALHPDPLLPRLSGDLTLRWVGRHVDVEIDQILLNPNHHRLHLATTLPLAPDARIVGLEFAGLRATCVERRAARRLFDAERNEGRTAVLLNEGCPGTFTQEIGCLTARRSWQIRTRLAYSMHGENAEDFANFAARVHLRFDAGAPISRCAQSDAVVHSGDFTRRGHAPLLDAFLSAVQPEPSSDSETSGSRFGGTCRGTIATCQADSAARGMFHGCLAGRPVRLLFEVQVAERGDRSATSSRYSDPRSYQLRHTALVAVHDQRAADHPAYRRGTGIPPSVWGRSSACAPDRTPASLEERCPAFS